MRASAAILLCMTFAAAAESGAFEFCDDAAKRQEFHRGLTDWEKAFQEKRFADLDRHFNGLLAAQASGKMDDATVKRAFAIFEKADPAREPLLLDWIRAHPKSQAAYLSIGHHYMARGFAAAGPKRSGASKAQTDAMEHELRYALHAFDAADAFGSKSTLSIAGRIKVASTTRAFKPLDAASLYRGAIKAHPDTLEVRIQFIGASRPDRGGSMRQLSSVIDDVAGMRESDRRYVRYLAYQEMGSVMEARKNPKRASEFYEKSIPLCPGLDRSLNLAAELYDRVRDFAALERTADILVERNARNAWALAMRGKARREAGKQREALADYERAVQLACSCAFEGLAWFHENGVVVQRDTQKAIELYSLAAAQGIAGAAEKAEKLRTATAGARSSE